MMLKSCNKPPPEKQLVIIFNQPTNHFEIGQYYKGHWYDQDGDAFHNISDWLEFTHWCELPTTYEVPLKRKEVKS